MVTLDLPNSPRRRQRHASRRRRTRTDSGSIATRLDRFWTSAQSLPSVKLRVGTSSRESVFTGAREIAVIAPGELSNAVGRALIAHILLGVGLHTSARFFDHKLHIPRLTLRGTVPSADASWAQSFTNSGPSRGYAWECQLDDYHIRVKSALAPSRLPELKPGSAVIACDGFSLGFKEGRERVNTLSSPELLGAGELSKLLAQLGYLDV